VIIDSKSPYVPDLTLDGIAVSDDGNLQKIANFSSVRVSP